MAVQVMYHNQSVRTHPLFQTQQLKQSPNSSINGQTLSHSFNEKSMVPSNSNIPFNPQQFIPNQHPQVFDLTTQQPNISNTNRSQQIQSVHQQLNLNESSIQPNIYDLSDQQNLQSVNQPIPAFRPINQLNIFNPSVPSHLQSTQQSVPIGTSFNQSNTFNPPGSQHLNNLQQSSPVITSIANKIAPQQIILPPNLSQSFTPFKPHQQQQLPFGNTEPKPLKSSTISLAEFASDIEKEITNKVLHKLKLNQKNPNNILMVTMCKIVDDITDNLNDNLLNIRHEFQESFNIIIKQQQQQQIMIEDLLNKSIDKLQNQQLGIEKSI
eukprot:14736_1